MIKKLVYFLITALAIYLTYTLVTTGADIKFRWFSGDSVDASVYSYNKILEEGEVLNGKLDEIDNLNEVDIVNARNKVETERKSFIQRKALYESLERNASEAEIAEANKKQEYLLDYLWIVIGNYANDNNVRFKMQTDDVNSKINFDITGSYVSIINFIYDLENDKNLNFYLDGIKIASGSSQDTTKAQFSVSGVTVVTSSSND